VIEVVAPGPLALVQDLGRPGWAHVGVGPSGAFDRAALRLANRLVGNREGAAGIEALGGGLALRMLEPAVVAVTGADGPVLLHGPDGSRMLHRSSPLHLREGDVLELGAPSSGLRSYVAVRRGLGTQLVLGSRATDTLGGLGPAPLRTGDVLPPASDEDAHPHVDHAPVRRTDGPLRVVPGPRDDWFDDDALLALTSSEWRVAPASDRVGVRLSGPALGRRVPGAELASEPVVTGALQVPADGLPVLLGPDRPTTGGYPVIAVVVDADVDRAAQLRPGDAVRFRTV